AGCAAFVDILETASRRDQLASVSSGPPSSTNPEANDATALEPSVLPQTVDEHIDPEPSDSGFHSSGSNRPARRIPDPWDEDESGGWEPVDPFGHNVPWLTLAR